jgi:sugar fermentation stimulation protein A
MKFLNLVPGRFLRRENRFLATALVKGREEKAYIANSGRLDDLLVPDQLIWLTPVVSDNRKTKFDLTLVEDGAVMVSIDARLPNELFEEALKTNSLLDFRYTKLEREVKINGSRLDFRLFDAEQICWVENKSVTLVKDGIALFPDAPTTRGRRHLNELMEISAAGDRAAVVFIIQRPDAQKFTPNYAIDPEFSKTLLRAHASGVDVFAYTCRVSRDEICLVGTVPVALQ